MEIAAVQIDHSLVIHHGVHAGKAGLYVSSENALNRGFGTTTEHQPRVSDQSEPEQTFQKQFTRREHSLEIFFSRLHPVLLDCLQE
ncbi:hypothetical protein D3C77_694210 [compost metagenome]